MAVNLINSNDIEVEQTGQDIQLKTSTPISTLEGGISDNANNIQNIINGEKYSTTEVKTNKIWFDGKPIYRKSFQFTTANNTSWNLIENNNYDYVTDINGELFAKEHYIGITKYINFYRLNGNLYYQNQTTFSQGKQITFWIEYTKTS